MGQEYALTCEAIDVVLSDSPQKTKRLQLGEVLRRMLRADVFASFVCDASGPYADPVQLDLGDDALRAYHRHFRHVDDLTPGLFARGSASRVSPGTGVCAEFVQDFLHRGGMYHGMNYFPAGAGPGSVDLRVWRGRDGRAFTEADARVFRSFGDLVARVWPREAPSGQKPLSRREAQVAALVADGYSDKQIAAALGIAPPTLRTHLSNAFAKTGAPNRAALAAYHLRHHQN
ncbi:MULTISPECIES: helix-turn-helix transcriptional regulator [Amycolatopsis]|uniref:Helix-turn-helix transcriptional regulator n=1 Tax=Amycolatopsis dendrobii TaxID=2760662 RepID=A0A7W3W3Q4_9PSEU|nr:MULTISPECIES: helix-turn-helix transcriptional regulator [Amycolatopsis]MBB1158164.1 helix-turn-helix transcriptional regulator [Amycolatopsis dendrobii]UKD56987.1 helix-turn-helix transcriptional regulator [Amycolatopsis sp. FU40]